MRVWNIGTLFRHYAGLKEARKQHNDTAKLSLHFRADESGIITLEKGEALSEISEEYTVKVPIVPEGLSPELSKALENITWPESFGQSNGTEKVLGEVFLKLPENWTPDHRGRGFKGCLPENNADDLTNLHMSQQIALYVESLNDILSSTVMHRQCGV